MWFEVKMRMDFRKSLVFPSEASVSSPSSMMVMSALYTSWWAFSISSKTTTERGCSRMGRVSWPPVSEPIYPGGEPTSRAASWRE